MKVAPVARALPFVLSRCRRESRLRCLPAASTPLRPCRCAALFLAAMAALPQCFASVSAPRRSGRCRAACPAGSAGRPRFATRLPASSMCSAALASPAPCKRSRWHPFCVSPARCGWRRPAVPGARPRFHVPCRGGRRCWRRSRANHGSCRCSGRQPSRCEEWSGFRELNAGAGPWKARAGRLSTPDGLMPGPAGHSPRGSGHIGALRERASVRCPASLSFSP